MSFLRNLDIKPKILASTLGIVFVTTLVIDVAIFAMQYHTAKTNLDARLNIEANIISQNISASVLFVDTSANAGNNNFFYVGICFRVIFLGIGGAVCREHCRG